MKKSKLALAMLCALASGQAAATLSVRSAFQNAALSVDGVTSNGNTAQVQTDTPNGAEVLKAYLYVSDIFGSGNTGNVTLGGQFLAQGDGTLLTPNANPANTRIFDVTSILKPAIEGSWGLQNHTYSEQGQSDGAVLVVVYRTASTDGTAILMDGELSQGGDSTRLDFASAYTSGDVVMSLASSFSFNGPPSNTGQITNIDVTTNSTIDRRLTSCAGGNDDAAFLAQDGSLMTAGGIGDSSANPDPTCDGGGEDDELYNLAQGNSANASPFLNSGDTFVQFDTNNPSFDDNVFMLAFTTTFQISKVDDEVIDDDDDNPPNPVSEPGSLGLLGALALAGLSGRKRRRKQ